jgi:hypothetical protein
MRLRAAYAAVAAVMGHGHEVNPAARSGGFAELERTMIAESGQDVRDGLRDDR